MLESGSYAFNSTKRKRERVGRLVMMHANHREEVETVYTGDICGIVGLKDTTTADTLCDEKHPIILESMEFPDPVIQVAIEPKTKAGQDKMTMALVKLAEEDPTFKTYTDQQDRPDDHRRHGRVASGDHRGPPDARVQGRGHRGQAPGRLPRDHPQGRQGRGTLRGARPAATASSVTAGSRSSPSSPARATRLRTRSSAA